MTNCDRESIKTLVVLHGQRKAARIAGLSENTVKSWALRYGWNKLPKPSPHPTHPIRTRSPAAIVADELSQNKARSTLALSRYSAQASEQAAVHPDKLGIAGKVKDVSSVHKTLWPEETAREQIINVDFLVNYSPPPGVEGHDPLKWERWRRRHPEEQVLDAPSPDPGEKKAKSVSLGLLPSTMPETAK